jgi:FecR-like protein
MSPKRFLSTVREMILRVDSKSLQRGIRWSCLLFLLTASIQWMGATALAQAVDARVASVKGTALRRNNQRAFILARGDSLNPGDEVDTRGGGRVVIELTDGSVVVVHPNSRIVISDYRAAASLREMFRILIGRVRVKVAHYGGKPNPYRVNSPTASILVRGTEFGVAVESSGDTRVEVYDGLVEVQSLSDPRQRVLLSKGRGALVKTNEEIRFFTPGSGNRTDERGGGNDGGGNDGGGNDGAGGANAGLNADDDADKNVKTNPKGAAGANANTNAGVNANTNAGANANTNAGANANANTNAHANLNNNADRDDVGGGGGAKKSAARRSDDVLMEKEKKISSEAAGKLAARPTGDNNQTLDEVAANATTSVSTYLTKDYERYVDSLAGRGWSIPLQRFTAFADSHFDSLDNPAYSTEFASIEGRAWLIPFFNKSRGGSLQGGPAGFPLPGNLISPFDSGLLSQFDFFIPLEKVRMVIGGAIAISKDRSQSLTVDQAPASVIRLLPGRNRVSRYVAVSTETTSITGSLVAARRFGDDGRTSVGVGMEWVSGGDDLRGQTSLANGARARTIEELEADSQIRRLRLRLGMTRKFDGGHKLGLVYSHELATADDRDRSRLFAGRPLGLDSTRQEGQSSEVSFRLRGPLTRRLFYGLEGSYLWGGSDGQIRRSFITDSTTQADADSASVGFGVGYALRRAMVLSADFAFGLSNVGEERREDATGNTVENRRERGRFVSGRVGLQTDVWRQLFASASTLVVGYVVTTDIDLRPDRFGRRLTSLGLPDLDGRSRHNSTDVFSDFGAGWRFKPNLLAEYIFSINNGLGPPRHIFLLRYTFKREE